MSHRGRFCLKMKAILLFEVALLASVCIASGKTTRKFEIVRGGKARCVIVVGEKATALEQHSAEEFARYVYAMTGARIPILNFTRWRSSPMDAVVIGRVDTNELLGMLVDKGALDAQWAKRQKGFSSDGFLIQSASYGGKKFLVLCGAVDHATLYAVYELLERFGRIGFFRDGEFIPKRKDFAIEGVEIIEVPFFKYRIFGGQWIYWEMHSWDEEEWRREIDWYAKKRINVHTYFFGPAGWNVELVEIPMWRELGCKVREPTQRQRLALEVSKRLNQYARMLGVRSLVPTSNGYLPPAYRDEFLKAHPNVRLLRIRRGDKVAIHVHPADDMFVELNRLRVRTWTDAFGETGVYYLPDPYSEWRAGRTPKEQSEIITAFAQRLRELTRMFRPQAWCMITWAFNDRKYWTRERVRQLLDAIPEEVPLLLLDLKSEQDPCYEYYDYWFGRRWAFVALVTMGMHGFPMGDVNKLLARTHEVLLDRPHRAKNLCGFGIICEHRDYSPLYLELAFKIAWNPNRINLEDFLLDFAQRRYGERGARIMMPALRILIRTVYGPHSGAVLGNGFRVVCQNCPLYFWGLGESYPVPLDEHTEQFVKRRAYFIPQLRNALRIALRAEKVCRGNSLYKRDLVDIARCYLHAVFNNHVIELLRAFKMGDRTNFEFHARSAIGAMQRLAEVIAPLANRPDYGVKALVENYSKLPWGGWDEEEVKHHLLFVVPGRAYQKRGRIWNYYRTDRYELIRDVYLPRVKAFIKALREELEGGRKEIPIAKLSPIYRDIEESFVKQPVEPPERAISVSEVVRRILRSGIN